MTVKQKIQKFNNISDMKTLKGVDLELSGKMIILNKKLNLYSVINSLYLIKRPLTYMNIEYYIEHRML